MKMHTAALLAIKDRKLLLAFSKNKQCFYLPGGKVDQGDTAETALRREIEEELNTQLNPDDLVYYTHISAPAYGEEQGTMMEQDCFLIIEQIRPVAAAEIGELKYFTVDEYRKEQHTAPGAVMILEQLKADGLID